MSRFRFVSDHQTPMASSGCVGCSGSRARATTPGRSGRRRPMRWDVELSELIGEIHRRSAPPTAHPGSTPNSGAWTSAARSAWPASWPTGLVGAHARRKWRTGRPDVAPAPDLVQRNFSAGGRPGLGGRRHPVPHRRGLALLRWRRRPLQPPGGRVGHGTSPDADLVIDALLMAFERRRPDQGVIHRWDRGAPTPPWPSVSASPSSAWPDRSARRGTASTTPRSRRCGPHSSGSWRGSTGDARGQPGIYCGRRSSTTSKASTTPSASRSASVTVHQPTTRRRPWLSNTCTETGSIPRPGNDGLRWLFVGDGQAPSHQNTVGHRRRTTLRKASLEGLKFHDLRHVYASGLIPQGCDVVTAREGSGAHLRDHNAQRQCPPVARRRSPDTQRGGSHVHRGPRRRSGEFRGLHAD